MSDLPTFDEYVASLGRLTAHVDPTGATQEANAIRDAAAALAAVSATLNIELLANWIKQHPRSVPVLGLSVGLSQEKLKNVLKHHFNTSGWVTLARERPRQLVEMLDEEFDLVRLVNIQRRRNYDFGDVLVARAGTRTTASQAGASGRKVEDEIEAIIRDLGLSYEMRCRFQGRGDQTGPCDLAIPTGDGAQIVVAAKGFDSTGSKLTAAVEEVEKMAAVRLPRQFVIAVIDGIGWKSRVADLRRIYRLWETREIDGMYTLASLGDFRRDVSEAARLRQLLS